jgi:hypothetical protein
MNPAKRPERSGGTKAGPRRGSGASQKTTVPPAAPVSTAAPPDRGRLGRRSRAKGKTFELLAVHEMREIYGPQVKRGIGQARAGGEVADIEGTPFWIEAKHRLRPNIAAALEQAVTASKGTRPALAITRANGAPIIVSMYLNDFRRLVLSPELKPLWCDDCGLAPMPPSYCVHGVCRVGRTTP